ncbi:hypothetical protein MKEN_00535200 [Mycena kentingensis (nom. inval.)]|nr:hypothetical protein MKEN_00535200 [Mycena kentingensis (nom. inval.)]
MLSALSRETKGILVLVPVVLSLYWLWGRSSSWGSDGGRLKGLHALTGIAWAPCREDASFQCGYLHVPTDYSNASVGPSRLALTKLPASCAASERLGSILTNVRYLLLEASLLLILARKYGGPGVSGRSASFGTARRIQDMTGSRHDIISFDQRGLGHSTPRVNCFNSSLRYQTFKSNTVFETTFSVPNNPASAAGRAVLVEQQIEALALEEAQAMVCAETMGAEALGYMSTTTTVYDMEEISRVLEEEKAPINFWGGSYGTIVGGYLANMLPHKAGKIYMDGVVSADMWSNEHYESQALIRIFLIDSEKTYQFFLSECLAAGPQHCALAQEGDTSPAAIGARIDAFIDRLQAQPLQVPNHVRPGFLTSGGVRSTLFNALQFPETWPTYADMLARAMASDAARLMHMIKHPFSDPSPPPDPEGLVDTGQGELMRLAISCGDALPYGADRATWPTAEGIVDEILTTLKEFPRFGATVHMMEQHGGCQFWPGTGVGPTRYRGPWNKPLATPMLLVASKYDPITPYAAAKIVKDTMGDSARLILQDTAGHSVILHPFLIPAKLITIKIAASVLQYLAPMPNCTIAIIRRYFTEGVVPTEPETRCPREIDNFFTDKRVFGPGVNPTILRSVLGEGM